MEADPPELGTALLRWASAFNIGKKIETLSDLRDGEIIWKILHDVEPEYFSSTLPEAASTAADNWIPRWQNLKYINRAITTYLRDERNLYPHYIKRVNLDLKAIATDASRLDTTQLLKQVFLAAFWCPNQQARMLQMMNDLGPAMATPIAHWLKSLDLTEKNLAEAAEAQADTLSDVDGFSSPRRSGTPISQPLAYDRDPELEREERLLRAEANVKELERLNTGLVTQLEEARARQRELEDDLTEAKYRLEHGGSSDASNGIVESLRSKADQDKDYISQLEQELEATREAADAHERQLQKLKTDIGAQQALRDELQMIKVERDDLVQKAKASENLKKKILSMQDAEKQLEAAKKEMDVQQEQLRALDVLKKRNGNLQRAHEQAMKALANTEQEIFDQTQARRRLENEVKLLAQRVEAGKERAHRDAETINGQEERIRDLEAGNGKTMDDLGDLDSDMSTKDKIISELTSRVTKLEAEYLTLQESAADGPDDAATEPLRKQIEQYREKILKMEDQYLHEYQERLGLEATLKDTEADVKQSQPFLHVRDRLHDEIRKRELSERKVNELETQIADLRATVKAKETKLALVDKSKAAAAEELRQSVEFESETLQDENKRLLNYARMCEEDVDDHRSLLRHALLNARALLQEQPDERGRNEVKLIMEELEAAINDPSTSESVARHIAARIEATRASVKDNQAKAAETQARLEDTIMSLEARLKKADEDAKKGTSTPLQENLQRELTLVTSAWYDMNNRLQSDAVVVQRRSEAPRSFLGRQRRLVSNPSIPKRR